ncbi:hypothetical protein [Pedobacter sp. WC2423]|uniref:hypothetical protein n=1 Tax=Pedobacter sp. WC2423 TaxID=3234142 RepID=UPI003467D060
MNIVYKILFEVKLLHEFYLTDKTGGNIFDFAAQGDRLNFLSARLKADEENIEEELVFEIPVKAKALFADYHLKLIPAYAGFKVAVKVIPKKILGTTVYEPMVSLPDDLDIPVLIKRKSQRFDNFTNLKMESVLPAAYCFSNHDVLSGSRVFPYLSAEIPEFDAAASYDQGELVKFGVNNYREFYRDDADAVQWISLPSGAFVNESDRLILPLNFCYTFPAGSGVTEADFLLRDKDGNVIAEMQFKNEQQLRKVAIAIDPRKVSFLPLPTVTDRLLYTLEVTGDGGYHQIHTILFYGDEQEIRESHGLLLIRVKTTVPAYDLLDSNGRLITRKLADYTVNPAPPVFELNFKSKPSFWRYLNSRRKDLKSGLHPDFLFFKNGALISKLPRAATYTSTLFRKPDNSLYYLPNPEPYQTVVLENNKLYSDIIVQESTLFPLAP